MKEAAEDIASNITSSDFIGLGIGGVLLWFVGRQMVRLWGAWGDFGDAATKRASDDEDRADRLQERLDECSAERARMEERCSNLTAINAELRAIIDELRRGAPPD